MVSGFAEPQRPLRDGAALLVDIPIEQKVQSVEREVSDKLVIFAAFFSRKPSGRVFTFGLVHRISHLSHRPV